MLAKDDLKLIIVAIFKLTCETSLFTCGGGGRGVVWLCEKCSRAIVCLDVHQFTQHVAFFSFSFSINYFLIHEENVMINCAIPVGEKHFL